MLIKWLLLLPVVLLAGWMILAGVFVDEASTYDRAEQLTLGSIGDPDNLNPIISSTVSAAEVDNYAFNGLLKYDENINIVGDLAERFQLTQDSTAFFASAQAAAVAMGKLRAARARWADMKLQSVRQDDDRLVLHFADASAPAAGTGYEEALLAIIDRKALTGVTVLTVSFNPGSGAAGKTADEVQRKLTALAGRCGVRIWETVPIGTSLLGVSVLGDAAAFREQLPAALSAVSGEVADWLAEALLNEPVITFVLRPNVRWQDGEPLTAGDAAFTYRAILDPQYLSPRGSDFWPVKSVAAPDERTFVVRYRYPYSESVSSWMMSLLPRHILEGRSAEWWADHYNSRPIGTGPFRITEWRHNEFIRLEAFAGYFEGPPNLPAVVYRILPDPFVNEVAFDAREFDVNTLLPFQVRRYEHDRDFEVFRRWGLGYDYIGWNLESPLFADKSARVALAHAVNVERIIRYVYRGYARQANGTFPPQMWYADKDLKCLAYDPALARRMLAEAGWADRDGDGILEKDGRKFRFTLITNNGNTLRASIQMLVQDDLKKVGIAVDTATYEWAVFIKNYIDARQFDACVLGWSVGYSFDQYQIWHGSQAKPPGLNFVSYRSPRADELLLKIRTTFGRPELTELCRRLQKVIYDDQPYLFVAFPETVSALYADKYVVRRPSGAGGWIVEPIRNTKMGFMYYDRWWAEASRHPLPGGRRRP